MIDPSQVFRVPFKVLKVFGIWQEKTSSLPYRFYGFFVHFLFIDLNALSKALCHIFYLFHIEDIQSLSDCLSTLLTNFGEIDKTTIFVYKLKNIQVLVKSAEDLILLSKYEGNRSHNEIKKVAQ